MPKRASSSFAKTVVWVVVLSYMVFLVGRSTYQNYTLNRTITTTQQEIVELERKNSFLKLALLYYRSNSFKEIQARQHLGLKGKDEKVVALPNAKTEAEVIVSSAPTNLATTKSVVTEETYMAWWHLFFQ